MVIDINQALARIEAAASLDALEALRVEFLGKQGSISALLKTLGGMSPEQRQAEGPKIHALRWKPAWPQSGSTCRCPHRRPRAARSTPSRR